MALVMFAGSLKYTASMPPCATGFARKRNATTPTTMRTTTSAMATGAAGGNIRFALSNSSVMGTCPASNFGAAGLRGGLLSAMDCSIGRAGFRPALTVSVRPGSGCYTAAPFVSLPAAAGAARVRTWGVSRHPLLRRIRSIRFAMRPGPPMILRCMIRDVLGSPIFEQRSNEDQRRLVRIGELAVHQQPLFVQTLNCILYGFTAGGKCSTTSHPELAQGNSAGSVGDIEWVLAETHIHDEKFLG